MKASNPTVIGAFVLGAGLLAVFTLIFIGSLKLFSKETTFVLYFDESVNGLSVGAPVKFKGVPLGRVSDILIHYNQPAESSAVPVFVRLDPPRRVSLFLEDDSVTPAELLEQEIWRGLRAKLQMESLITGQLYVELDYIADFRESPPVFLQREPLFPEIPTTLSVLARIGSETTDFVAQFSTLDFKGIAQELTRLLTTAREKLEPLDTVRLQQQLQSVLEPMAALLADDQAGELVRRFNAAAGAVESLAVHAESGVVQISAELQSAVTSWRELTASARASLKAFDGLIHPAAPIRSDLERTLNNLVRLSENMANLLEMLEADPAALIRGRATTNRGL